MHFNLTFGERDGKCLTCGNETMLGTSAQWHLGEADDFVEPADEVACHYCAECSRLTAVFVNTPERR